MSHPMQPIERDAKGVLRFRQNKIVAYLLEQARATGCDMNTLACLQFSNDDREQFAQLIGYSLSGFGELSYVSNEAHAAAEKMAESPDASDALARIENLRDVLEKTRNALRDAMSILYRVHPDDLKGVAP